MLIIKSNVCLATSTLLRGPVGAAGGTRRRGLLCYNVGLLHDRRQDLLFLLIELSHEVVVVLRLLLPESWVCLSVLHGE